MFYVVTTSCNKNLVEIRAKNIRDFYVRLHEQSIHSCSFRGGLSFEFKTFARNGILFFSRSDTQSDFISCYLQDGYVYFAFDTGAGIVVFKTENVVNDGTWKKVLFIFILLLIKRNPPSQPNYPR